MRLQLTTWQALLKRGALAVVLQASALSENIGYATPGKYIRHSRIGLGLTQKDLASHIGVHKVTVRVWKTGKKYPRKEQWEKLMEVLDLSPEVVDELLLMAASDESSGHGRLALLHVG